MGKSQPLRLGSSYCLNNRFNFLCICVQFRLLKGLWSKSVVDTIFNDLFVGVGTCIYFLKLMVKCAFYYPIVVPGPITFTWMDRTANAMVSRIAFSYCWVGC